MNDKKVWIIRNGGLGVDLNIRFIRPPKSRPTTTNSPPTQNSTHLGQGIGTTGAEGNSTPRFALAVAVLGFFVITLNAFVVNVALPDIGQDLGGGITGLQWVVNGYTLMFAALLLSAGSFSDRIGARQSFGAGLMLFTGASLACGLAPVFWVLVIARLAQGVGAAVMTPASLALIREAYPEERTRPRSVANSTTICHP